MNNKFLNYLLLGIIGASAYLLLTKSGRVLLDDLSTSTGGIVEKLSASFKALIARLEGYRSEVYLDQVGKPTIGYGHLIKPGEPWQPYGTRTDITLDEANALLEADTAIARSAVDRFVTVPLTQGQKDALISFVFNVGEGAFSTSTLLKLLNAGNYDAAANEFGRWNMGTLPNGEKVVIAGLVNRRAHEKDLFLT